MNSFDIDTQSLFGTQQSQTNASSSTFGSQAKPFAPKKSVTAQKALGGGQPDFSSSSSLSKPVVTNPSQTSAWNLGDKRTGKKSSARFFESVKIAWNAANLSDDERYALMKNVKKLPLGEESAIRAQHAENVKKAVEANGEEIKNSRPQQTQNAQLENFISGVKKLRASITMLDAMKWGTVLQLDFFQSLHDPALKEFVKISPHNREMLMSNMVYNVLTLKEGTALMDLRWKAFNGVLKCFAEMGVPSKKMEAGSQTETGQKIVSGYIFFDLSKVEVEHIEIDSEEAQMSLSSLLQAGWKVENLQYYLAAANCTNYYTLKQASDVRRNKGDAKFIGAAASHIMKKMASVISLAGMADALDGQNLNLNPKGAFCKVFFAAKAFMGATLRGINAQLFGIAGGADTRSVTYGYVSRGVPDFESFDF